MAIQRPKKILLALLSLALLPIVPLLTAPAAHAVGSPFTCNANFYQISNGQFWQLNVPGFTYSKVGTNSSISNLNSAGWNPADNYIYAMSSNTTLEQIASDGSITSPGSITGLTAENGGDFITNDKMIVVSSGSSTIQLLTLNRTGGVVTSGTATNITTTGSGYSGSLDIAIFPSTGGTYVGYSLNGTVLTTFTFPNGSPTTATYTTETVTGLQNGSSGAFGAQWVDSQGNFYAYDNTTTPSASTNALYEINRTDLNGAASSIPAQDVAEETSPGSAPNDGVSCRTAPSVFAPQMVTTAAITNVTGTTALATGYLVTNVYPVNPLGTENNAKICYSTSSATDSTPGNTYGLLLGASCFTTSQTFPANTSTQNFSVTLTGLSPNTTYYYQSAAVNTPSPSTIAPFAGFSPVASFTTPAIPTFTSISPSSGSVGGGTTATITGTNFTGATSVTIDGIPVTSFTVNSPTSITITTPAGTSLGAKNVVVTAPGGTATGPAAFTYVGQITFNANGGTGTMAPQTGSAPATINANTFTYTGSTFLGWNTAADGSGTAYAAGATYPFSSSTTLYAQWLTVASVAPPSGPLGSTTPITITGTGFTGATGVTVGGVAATSVVVVNSTTITAVVPTSATVGAKDVVVTTPAGTGTGTGKFTYNATVTFNGNGSDGGSTAAQLASTATALTTNGFTRTGYTFAGWNTVAGGGGTAYANGATFPFTADTTLYAQWTAIHYSVTYNINGGTGTTPTDATSYTYNQAVTTKASTGFTNGTKVFAGWNTSSTGPWTTTSYKASQSSAFNITANTTLYALWNTTATPTLTAVSVTAGDVSGGTTSVLTGTNFIGTTSVTIGGVPVTSFSVNAAGTSITIVTAPNSTPGVDNIVVTTVDGTVTGASGKQFTYQATVTFNGNGNTGGSTAAQTAHVNTTSLTTNGFTKTGYTFAGWNTAANGSGTAYANLAPYTFTADLTLYAQWTPSTYAVTYNAGTGGTGTPPTDPASPYAAGATVTVVAGIGSLTKTSSFFAGWNTATNGSGTMYAAGATFTMPGNALPLYAIWGATSQAAPTITSVASANTGDVSGGTTATITGTNFYGTTGVQVNCNGSLINVTSWVVNSSTQITVVMPACAKTGAAGFQVTTKPNLTYLNSGTPQTSGAATFTYNVTVSFNSNGGTGTIAPETNYVAANLTSDAGFTPPTGYAFANPVWSTNPGGGGTTYTNTGPSNSFNFATATADVTLYAQYVGNTIALTYNGNGYTGGTPPTSPGYTAGSTVTVLGNTGSLTLTNETFFGWNTAANGSGTSYAPGATFTMPGSPLTLYAQWTTVASISPNSGTLNGGTPITITGTNFTGATGATINGVAVTSFVVVNPTTITAVTPAGTTGAAKNVVVTTATGTATGSGLYTYFATVTFNNNGGSGTMANQTASVATALTTNTFTRSLYTFSGWNTAADYSGTSYGDAASYPFTADVTLYAKWLGPPSITTVTPNVGPLAGGTSVTVTGTNFTGATSVTIDGVPVTSYTVNSSTSITLTTPAGSTIGAKNLVITTPYGIATGTGVYSYQTTVTFNSNGGSGTMANQSAAAASALTTNAFTYTNSTFLGWNTAANGSGTSYADTASFPFTANTTLYAQWLHVTSVSPTSGTIAGGTSITITGTGFTGATGVTIGGVAATSVVVVNATTITAVTPAGSSIGAKDIVVTTPSGSSTGTGLFTYNPIAITITSNAASKIYGASDPSLTGFTISSGTLKTGDVIGSVSASRVSGENVGTYNITPSAAVFTTGSASNYTITYATGTFTISVKALTVTAASTSPTYGTAITPSFTTGTGQLVGSDSVTGVTYTYAGTGATTYGPSSTAPTAVGTYSVTPSAATGTGLTNYTITYTAGSFSITAGRALTVTAASTSPTYGTAITPSFTTGTGQLVGSDSVTGVTYSYAGTGATTYGPSSTAPTAVGTYSVTPSAATGTGLTNYTITYTAGSFSITAGRALTVTAASTSPTYGTAITPSFTTGTGQLVGSDSVTGVTYTYAGTGATTYGPSSTAPTAVGTYSVTPSAATGTGLTNYTITYTAGSFSITAGRALTVTAASTSPTYGTAITPSFTTGSGQLVGSDSVTGVTYSYAGTGATTYGPSSTAPTAVGTYSVTPSAATGTGLTNYTITYTAGSFSITAGRALTVTAASTSPTYGTAITPSFTTGSGQLVGSDSVTGVTYSYAGTGATTYGPSSTAPTAVGTYSVTPSAATGTGLTNYTITYTAGSFSITAGRALTVTAASTSPTYGTAITPSFTTGSGQLVGSDSVTGVTYSYAGTGATTYGPSSTAPTAVGTYSVTPSAATGTGLTNYTITYTAGSFSITAGRALTVTAASTSPTYGTAITPSFTTGSGQLVGSDSVTGVTYSYAGTGATTYGPSSTAPTAVGTYSVTPSAATGTGLTNYTITYTAGSFSITAGRALTVTAASTSPTYGTAITPSFTTGSGQLVGSDSVTGVTYSYAGTGATTYGPSSTAPTAVGTYSVTPSAATGTGLTNYTITYTAGSFSITAGRALTVTAASTSPTYGTAITPSFTTGSGQLVGSDSVTGVTYSYAGTGATTYGPSSTAPTAVGTYSVTPSAATGTGLTNYTITYTAGSFSITAGRALTVTAASTSPTYGTAITPSFTTGSGQLVGSDSVTGVTYSYAGTGATTYGPSSTAPTAVGTYSVTPSAATGTGLTNYTITYTAGSFSITAGRALTVTAASTSPTYGTAITPSFTTGSGQLVGSDSVTGVTYSYAGTGATTYGPSSTAPTAVGTYSVTPSAATGTGLTNYTITYTAGSFSITAGRALTVTAASTSPTYGTAITPSFTTGSGQLVGSDSVTGVTYSYAGTGATTYGPSSTAPTAVGTYSVTPSAATGTGLTNYTITYTAGSFIINPVITATAGSNGSISPAGSVPANYGDTPTFTITPATGYHVANVLVDGSSVGAVTSYQFSAITANHTISATFAINAYTITATAGSNGSISPAGSVPANYGDTPTFTITPATGYHVANVLVDGSSVGAVTSYQFSAITANHTISATFAANSYSVTYLGGAGVSGTAPTQGNVDYNATFTTAANTFTKTGYTFAGWNDGTSTYAAGATYTMPAANVTLTATWTSNSNGISYNDQGGSGEAGGDTSYSSGSSFNLPTTAPTRLGYTFAGWFTTSTGGSALGATYAPSSPYGAVTIYAHWSINNYSVTYLGGAGASGTAPTQGNVDYNATFTTAANTFTKTGYTFAGWNDGTSTYAAGATYTMPAANVTLTATWSINSYTITATAGSNGSISPAGSVPANYGDTPTFTITPATGYHVANVLVDGSSVGAVTSYQFSAITANHTISATFAINAYTITATAGSNGSISPAGSVPANYGDTPTFTITPATGYHVANVLVDGSSVGAVTSYQFSAITANHTISATFAANSYSVTYLGGAGVSGTAPTQGNVDYNATFTTAANTFTKTGYTFAGWNDGTSTYAAGATYTMPAANVTLTATWTSNSNGISYNDQGGSGEAGGDTSYSSGSSFNLPTTAPTRLGYTFAGWFTTSTGGSALGATYAPSSPYGAVTIYAHWSINNYSVTYLGGAGASGTAPTQGNVDYNATFTTAANTFTKTGYTFAGWNDGTSTYAAGATYTMPAANVTLTATWSINSYTITATAGSNGSISPAGSVPANYGDTPTFTITPATGYHVANVLVDGSSVGAVTSYQFSAITANHTISATFAINAAPSHTVTFDGNTSDGGSTAPQTANAATALTSNGFTKAGYTFTGWNTLANGTGTAYGNGATYSFTADLTLYAQWTINAAPSHTVTFDGNTSDGGSTAPQTANAATALTSNGFTKAGYTFTGWNTLANGTGTAYGNGATYSFTADLTLYAQWTINAAPSHTVTFDGNTSDGGSTAPQTANAATALTSNGFTKAGYSFSGWTTAADGTGTAYGNGATYSFTADLTLYAQWTINAAPSHTVTFDGNTSDGGSTAPQTANAATALTSNGFTKAGYTFTGWNTLANGTGTAYGNGATYSFTADLTLYAQWTINAAPSHTVTFDGNTSDGGSTAPQTANAATALTSNGFTKAGYSFSGWTTAADGTGTAYGNGATYSFTADLTLYAQWTINAAPSHTVTFDGNTSDGGSTAPETANAATALISNGFTKSGYTFTGWNTAADGTGTAYGNGATYSFTADLPLYAQWVLDTSGGGGIVVDYYAAAGGLVSDGTNPSSTHVQVTEDGIDKYYVTAVPSAGYHFDHWSDDLCTPTCSAPATREDSSATGSFSTTAIFAANAAPSHTVTFDRNGGNGVMSPETANTATALTAYSFTPPAGYSFSGWNTLANGTGTPYSNGATYGFSADVTLYAQWLVNTYNIVASSGVNGSISSPGTTAVNYGSSKTYTFTPSSGYAIASVLVDGSPVGAPSSYTFTSVSAAHTISVTFSALPPPPPPTTYTLTYVAGANGSISGTTVQTVTSGASGTAVTAVASSGFHFVQWSDNSTQATRTDSNVTANHTYTATFAADVTPPPTTYTLIYSAGANGSISGVTTQSVVSGGNGTLVTAVANTGYHFVSWSDGKTTAARTDFGVSANISVTASFAPNGIQPPTNTTTFTLSYAANANGTISGSATQVVSPGANGSAVTAVPNTGYHFVSWSDGLTTATRVDTNVLADHAYVANFSKDSVVPVMHTIFVSGGPNGTVEPLGARVVNDGDTLQIAITPDTNYHVGDVVVDGVSVGATNTYTFVGIQSDHTISATFDVNTNGSTDPGTGGGSTPIIPEGTDGVKATESGVNDPVVLSLLQGGTGVQLSAKNWMIQIASDKKSVYGIKLPTKIQVYLIRGVNATTNGTGFMPGTIARVYLYSTRLFLGQATVLADGTFAAHFPVSAETTLGYHVMQVEGTSYDGQPRTAAVGLQVINKPSTGLVQLGSILYDLNVSKLNSTNITKLAAAIATISAGDFKKIWIYGYTDRQTGVNNQALSRLRSKQIADLLNAILPKAIVGFKYFGPANPKDPAHTQAAYAQNRRSEIWGQT